MADPAAVQRKLDQGMRAWVLWPQASGPLSAAATGRAGAAPRSGPLPYRLERLGSEGRPHRVAPTGCDGGARVVAGTAALITGDSVRMGTGREPTRATETPLEGK